MTNLYYEVERPESLSEVDYPLFYMYSNSNDPLGETYKKIPDDIALGIVYKVYRKRK
ncbi:hypothetical protein NVP1121O_157 [Vibrio phage 1.121.O._10N.286.46.C4]|nr:hypothetical protein NVP1121O_157 [Vibrio phage 1.121.O._10N.286.46.C4]